MREIEFRKRTLRSSLSASGLAVDCSFRRETDDIQAGVPELNIMAKDLGTGDRWASDKLMDDVLNDELGRVLNDLENRELLCRVDVGCFVRL